MRSRASAAPAPAPAPTPSDDDDTSAAPAFSTKPVALPALLRLLFSTEPGCTFTLSESEEAAGLLRVLLALIAGVVLAAVRAEGWPSLLGAFVLVNAAAVFTVRYRCDIDEELVDMGRVVGGEAGAPCAAALLLSWLVAHNFALALR